MCLPTRTCVKPWIWDRVFKETTDTASSASFLDLYLEFDDSGQLNTKIYDKRDDFNFKIINFPNMCSNIPASPAYGVYISQLIRYARARRKRTNNDLQNITHKIKDRATRVFRKEQQFLFPMWPPSCYSCYIPDLGHKWGKTRIMISTNGTYRCSFVKFLND